MLTLLESSLSFFARALFTALFCLYFQVLLNGQDDIKIHYQYTPIQDYAGILSEDENQRLSQILFNYENKSKNQIVFAIVKSIYGNNLEEYANDWANKLGIGQKDTNNGIFVLIVMDKRKIRIEIGYGLEDKIPDMTTSYIIDNYISPSFKKNLYAEGIEKAISEFQKHLDGKYNNDKRFSEFYNKKNKKWYQFRIEEIFNYLFSTVIITLYCWFLCLIFFKKIVSESEKEPILETNYKYTAYKLFSIILFCIIGLYFTYRLGIRYNPKFTDFLCTFAINFAFLTGLTLLILIFFESAFFFIAIISSLTLVLATFLYLNSLSENDYIITLRFLKDIFYESGELSIYECLFLYPFGLFMTIFIFIWVLNNVNNPEFKNSGSSKVRDNSFSGSSGRSSRSYGRSFGGGGRSSFGGGSFGGGGASGGW